MKRRATVMRTEPGVVVAMLMIVAMSSCGGAPSVTPPATSQPQSPSNTASPSSSHPPANFWGTVEVADGRSLAARCIGAGAPTVFLEVGGSSNMDDWPATFVETLGGETTTCYYSRAGGRGSTRIVGSLMTRDQILDDAFTLLDTLRDEHGVDGPYIWVGWSFGGSVALMEALAAPDDSAGLVILDTDFPTDFLATCAASGRTDADCEAEYDGDREAKSIEADLVANLAPLPDIPLELVTALRLPDCHAEAGATSVSADIAGVIVTAPDCEALGVAIADKADADWGQLGQPVSQTRVEADHNGLVQISGDQIADIILGIVHAAR